MKILLAMVISADGKTTRGDDPGTHAWASPEDQAHFQALKEKIRVLIMGRKTYEAAGKPHGDGIRRIVMSRETGFVLPDDIEEVLLVGGSELNAEFFKRKLINEIYLTIEPKLFGAGLPLAQMAGVEVHLKLKNVTQLNPQGTLLLHYDVQ